MDSEQPVTKGVINRKHTKETVLDGLILNMGDSKGLSNFHKQIQLYYMTFSLC